MQSHCIHRRALLFLFHRLVAMTHTFLMVLRIAFLISRSSFLKWFACLLALFAALDWLLQKQ
eukprot:SAG31_NODE_653_length_13152_cov_4.899487_10_plen_62_part_00